MGLFPHPAPFVRLSITTGVCSQNPIYTALFVWVSSFDSLVTLPPLSRRLNMSPASQGLLRVHVWVFHQLRTNGPALPVSKLSGPCRPSSPPHCSAVAHHFTCQNASVTDKETKVGVLVRDWVFCRAVDAWGFQPAMPEFEWSVRKKTRQVELWIASSKTQDLEKLQRPIPKGVGKLCINVWRGLVPCTAVGCSAELLH